MFARLEDIYARPEVFGAYTADALWADAHRADQMLAYHLNDSIDVSSRNHAFIDRSASWIIDRFQLGPSKAVCDFGCGPGLYTSRLARSGARVTGLDFSKNSIDYARAQAGGPVSYVHANYLEFETDARFDLITLIMCDFCALSPVQRAHLLAKFAALLTDDGAILLDVYSMAAFAAREETSVCEKNQLNHFWCEEDYYCFVNTFKYEDAAVVLDKYSIFPERGAEETVYNWLQYFSPESLTQELAQAGFAVDAIYGDVAGQAFQDDAAEFAIAARKMP